jgi:two-component system, chemotaxis family, chemotaxis protein CheY
MKTLIVEDDFTSRILLQELLRKHGPCHVAINGKEALKAVLTALDAKDPYDLICLDIMMPEMDGQEALREIRAIEESRGQSMGRGARVLMTTALHDKENVMLAFREQCDGYLVKPVENAKLVQSLRQLGLIPPA